MPSEVEITLNFDEVVWAAENAGRRALYQAGKVALAASDVLAPREPVKQHPVHMTETGYVVNDLGAGDAGIETVRIGYTAWWAVLQHENLAYHHPHGGKAKFLEIGVEESAPAAFRMIAAEIESVL